MTHGPQIIVHPDTRSLAQAAAEQILVLAQAAIRANGRFSMALAGGTTPRALYQLLAQPPIRDALDWAQVFLFLSDERFVPPDDPDSNYLLVRETLLDYITIPAANIYPAPTIGSAPEAAAQAYAETIVAFFDMDLPSFDLILLGMGPDGHTASLFPGQPEPSAPGDQLVIPVYNSPKPPPTRLSFTYKLINAAEHVVFLVAGKDKATTLRAVLEGPPDRVHLPAQGVRPHGQLLWLIDAAAAQELHQP